MKPDHRPDRRGPPPVLTLPDQLRTLARRVDRLGVASRLDPETLYVEKASIADALRRLAREAAA